MNRRGALWVTVATFILVNAWLVGEGLINRHSTVQAVLTIDECRLDVSFADEPGLRLRRIGRFAPPPGDAPRGDAALALFGYDPNDLPRTAWRAARHAYVAVTTDPALADAGSRDTPSAPGPMAPRAGFPSPLVVFDAAPKAQTLIKRYADRNDVAVTRGLVRLQTRFDAKTRRATGEMTLAPDIRVDKLHLTLEQRHYLQRLGRPERRGEIPTIGCEPRFEVDVAFGAQTLAYVSDLRPFVASGRPDEGPSPAPQ